MGKVIQYGSYIEHIVAYCDKCGSTDFEILLDNEDDGNVIGIRCSNVKECGQVIDLVPITEEFAEAFADDEDHAS